jgi:hypothetical protein
MIDGKYQNIRYSEKESLYYENNRFYTTVRLYEINGRFIPLSAIIDNWNECEECGHIHKERACPVCNAKYTIQEYHAKAERQLSFKHGGEKHPLYMGIELEYEDCRDQVKPVIKALPDHVIIKRDGSINNGFEIVTAPATLAVHKQAFSGFFEKVVLFVKSNCGMHVHVSKHEMGEMQIGKLLSFLYKEENRSFLVLVAGRDFWKNHYCIADKPLKATDGIRGSYDGVSRVNKGKYQALNLSPNSTIEFRIFAPPLDEKTLFARLEFVKALVDFTRPAVVSVKEANDLNKFITWAKAHKKDYPNFVEMLLKSH